MDKEDYDTHASEKTPLTEGQRASKPVTWIKNHKRIAIPLIVMILLLPLLGLLALRNQAHARWTSPIVYPPPEGYGAGNWSNAYDQARDLVSRMTLEEMNNVTLGISDHETGCVGVSGGAPRLGFPGFCLHDAGNGVRNTDGVNAYAAGLHIGASWNSSLALERARFMGAEFKKKGVNVALGPVVGPLMRIASGGRAWEGFGSDPYLNGILGAQSVVGLQESVIASIKHFVGNEQETNRNPSSQDGKDIMSTSANIDDQTMHELYMWPFQDLLHAGAGSVMCAYNRLNQTYACENSKIMNGLLKGEMNFQGFVVSDWVAQHSGLESANAGLDMAMPTSSYWDRGQLVDSVNEGTLNRTRLEDMATRIIATWLQFGQNTTDFPKLGEGLPKDLLLPHNYTDVKDPAARPCLLQQAIEGHVLVKNVDEALPLKQPRVLSVFGYDAIVESIHTPGEQDLNGQPYILFPTHWGAVNLNQQQMADIASNTPLEDPPQTAMGTLIVGGGSGSNTPPYVSTPFDALQARASEDGTALFHDFSSNDPHIVASSDACLVFINEYASEVWDRPGLADAKSDELVKNVASKCSNTIVVIHNAGPRLVDEWIEHPNVTAVLFAHLPGQDAGRAVVQILYGDASPSGRLPYTVGKSEKDYGDLAGPCIDEGRDPQCDFEEGVEIDYRSFLARDVAPRYAFGYGLTYSTFEYSDLQIDVNATASDNDTVLAPVYANGTTNQNRDNPDIGAAGLTSLLESVGSVQAAIRNTGDRAAAEVAQLYIQTPSMSTRVLRGFQKVMIEPGESTSVSFPLRRKDVSSWDTERQAWVVPQGRFEVMVGKSVLDLPLNGTFTT